MHNQNNVIKLLLRLGFGGLMLALHGIPKVQKLFNGGEISFPDPLHIGDTASLILTVFAEVVCAFLIVIGFKSKWASIPLFFTMMVAAFIVHADDPFSRKEKAIIYAIGYLAIWFLGSGKYSVDRK